MEILGSFRDDLLEMVEFVCAAPSNELVELLKLEHASSSEDFWTILKYI